MKRFLFALALGLSIAALFTGGMVMVKRQELLIHAATRGDAAMLRGLIRIGADPNGLVNGAPPIYSAAWYGRLEAVTSLLDAGADVDAVDGTGTTALMGAASQGNDAMVKLLLERGADRNRRSTCGTPADIARKNHHASTEVLLGG